MIQLATPSKLRKQSAHKNNLIFSITEVSRTLTHISLFLFVLLLTFLTLI